MTSTTIRNGPTHPFPGGLKEIRIACDHIDCPTTVNDQTIRDNGGLKEMGWTVDFQENVTRHYCPEHKR